MTDERDYASNPTPRTLAAERRRRMARLIENSSLGTPGAAAVIKHGRGETLTPEEEELRRAEMTRLEADVRSGWPKL